MKPIDPTLWAGVREHLISKGWTGEQADHEIALRIARIKRNRRKLVGLTHQEREELWLKRRANWAKQTTKGRERYRANRLASLVKQFGPDEGKRRADNASRREDAIRAPAIERERVKFERRLARYNALLKKENKK